MSLWWWTLGSFAVAIVLLGRGRPLFWLWREIARAFILFELAVLRLVQGLYPPRFVLTGACDKRGTCCTLISGTPPGFLRRGWGLRLFAGYHRLLHGFEVRGRGTHDEIIFRCGHLQTDGRCGIYRYRPFICRNYPVLPWFEPPQPIPGCGFSVTSRLVARMVSRPSLRILNPAVSVHHPTRPGGLATIENPAHYELVAEPPELPS